MLFGVCQIFNRINHGLQRNWVPALAGMTILARIICRVGRAVDLVGGGRKGG